ncbi:hypothetical protein L596_016299 [Steinernema carpocapsae]|uniref:Uncharacterized protein n=1 Tax=Steinernema carpocapsae TaxID=34508 RepID=A0A4U5NIJ9_STECR|nr:hypothetical protein L596_016299 [Steinernema carpocapsae]
MNMESSTPNLRTSRDSSPSWTRKASPTRTTKSSREAKPDSMWGRTASRTSLPANTVLSSASVDPCPLRTSLLSTRHATRRFRRPSTGARRDS